MGVSLFFKESEEGWNIGSKEGLVLVRMEGEVGRGQIL